MSTGLKLWLTICHHQVWFALTILTTVVLFISIVATPSDPAETFTDRFIKRHPILTMGAASFIWQWMLLPIVNRVVFLFTPNFYRKQVIKDIKIEANTKYKHTIEELREQIKMMERGHREHRSSEQDYSKSTEEAYWDGVKYGYSLKSGSADKTNDKYLTESHIFTLQEIAKGNRTISGLVVAHLEEQGYVRLVWDNQEAKVFHYELTDKGAKKLSRRNQKNAYAH